MPYKIFEDYLQEQHAKQYTGLDDDMPEAYENWVTNLDATQLIQLSDMYGRYVYDNGFFNGQQSILGSNLSK